MQVRHILGIAVFWGVVGTLGGPTVQAAPTPNSAKFVQLLLQKEAKAIKSDTKALNMRDKDVAKLEATTNPRKVKQLQNTLLKLHNQILAMTTKLQAEAVQVNTAASALSPPNPALKSQALAELLMVQKLSLRAGLGLAPATPSQ
jgi:hypothetical protein